MKKQPKVKLCEIEGPRRVICYENTFLGARASRPQNLPLGLMRARRARSQAQANPRIHERCHVSPDAGWSTLSAFMKSVKTSLTVGMYEGAAGPGWVELPWDYSEDFS